MLGGIWGPGAGFDRGINDLLAAEMNVGGGGFGRRGGGGTIRSGMNLPSLIGFSTALNYGFHALDSSRTYGVEQALAGNDQRAQLDATLNYRARLTGETGFIGRAVGLLQDPTGMKEAAIRLTMEQSQAQDEATLSQRRSSEFSQGLRARANITSDDVPVNRQRRAAEEAHKEELRNIEEVRKAREAAINKELELRKRAMAATRSDRAFENVGMFSTDATMNAEVDKLRIREEGQLSKVREDRLGKSKARYEADVALSNSADDAKNRDINREYDFQRRIESLRTGSQIAAYRFEAANNRRAAEMATVVGEGRIAIEQSKSRRDPLDDQYRVAEAARGRIAAAKAAFGREDQSSSEDLRARGDVSQDLLNHQPLAARLHALDAAAERDLSNPNVNRYLVRRDQALARMLATQEDTEARGLRRMALAGENRSLNLMLNDSPHGARANDIATESLINAQQLRNIGDSTSANQVIQNAVLQEQVLRKSYLESFKPVEVDPTYTAINGPRGGQEDTVTVLREIKSAMDTLNNNLTGGVVVGP
jgi:hypothetical protein